MKNNEYTVLRNNIYVGEVIRPYNIYRYEGDIAFSKTKVGDLYADTCESYRSMLFVLDDNKLANDLLYDSPLYPVLNITDDMKINDNDIVIRNACNLAILLAYFNYGDVLSYNDIVRIRETFFSGRFAKDNCELFGFSEMTFDRELSSKNMRFVKNGDNLLLSNYFDVLDYMGDNSLFDVIGFWHGRINAFAPEKREGRIKKLKRNVL